MNDFLESNNACGQTLLRIVSQGNAIVSEVHRLADMVPVVFRLDNKQDQATYGELIMDFNYFKSSDAIDHCIEKDDKLLLKDEELRETYIELLAKFYLVFESIHRYAVDIERFLSDLEEGMYIQQTIDTVLMDYDGKQLMCEALYLMGVMLLTLDRHIEGVVRERMLVAYYRYAALRTSESKIDDVCNLVRATGYTPNSKRPANYPEDFFKRVRIRPSFVRMVIGRLRSDDIYNLSISYPKPEHRSVGLSTQASMLFITLYFAPDILSGEQAIMREIVDKFFADNFVISVYMGTIINLVEHWDPYKAAKAALSNTLELKNIRSCALRYRKEIGELNPKLSQLLKEGVLTEENILNRINEHLNTIRNANVTLRWIMLHTVPLAGDFTETYGPLKRCKQVREHIVNELKFNPIELFKLLLNTSEFELRIKDIYKQILAERYPKLVKYKQETCERINELAEVFSGSKPLNRVEPNSHLQKWFEDFAKKIDELDFDENFSLSQINATSRRIIQLIKALEEVQEFEQLESNLQVKQHLAESNNFLHLMIKTLGIREEVLITQQIIADLSYAWKIIDECFTRFMQEGIKRDPTLVAKLRAAFLKLASALDMPLLRINQNSSSDLMLVSQFYSSELVSYVRKVLHIIPETMFALMDQIIRIQTNKIKELPTRLMKDQLKSYAQLDERFEIAQLTHAISVFTQGVLAMKTTLVGVIQIDPKRLLEDGIRRELVRQVMLALHKGLIFNPKAKISELKTKLIELQKVMDGFRRTFEYIQDYVCINGLKMWQEELSRIINYNVEQECNAFMRQKVLDYQSLYQSKSIPIPKYIPLDPYSLNFIGRLVREITRITDPKATIYVYSLSSWYDNKSQAEIVDGKLFSSILKIIGVAGTNGIDRLLSFQIVSELNKIFAKIDLNFVRNKSVSECFSNLNNYLNNDTPNGIITAKSFIVYYIPVAQRLSKILVKLAESIGHIGQLQVIRQNLNYELAMASKFQARQLASALQTFNSALMTDFAQQCFRLKHSTNQSSQNEKMSPVFQEESPLLFELSDYLEYNGISDPLCKVYTRNRLPPNLDLILLMVLITQMPKFVYVREINALAASSSSIRVGDSVDGTPFVIGFLTILRQFHPELVNQFFRLGSQFVNACIQAASTSQQKQSDIPVEAINMLQFLYHCCVFGQYKRRYVAQYLPDVIVDQFHSLGLNSK